MEAYIVGGNATPGGKPIEVPNGQIVGPHLGVLEPLGGRENAIDAFFDFAVKALEHEHGKPPQVMNG